MAEDYVDDERQKREDLLGMGLDPVDPDPTDLAPAGMTGDETDDEDVADDEGQLAAEDLTDDDDGDDDEFDEDDDEDDDDDDDGEAE
jgi:hypothetical protein